ncbi:NADH:flavin oxidoreductase/NADH oxidase [Paenibacillus protaetiae]|uniref:NADH:flavin oxidoreductase/NADH oxidase n=1 Tax=Paenibacillus protaetiae TaxID=2509456 RepID=A0A4V0YFK6_9BACL|nr:NADH:flavin oxidoreductase/NADH oxidase [Paenibacillus protaetiae]QAY68041.1 NADH:flavin oxidoreductase/NADH oxidase [Paenibacillus protaetiae]
MTSILNTPFRLNGLELKNRVVMAPMCQYSVDAKDGIPNEWHYVHYISRAAGGAGLIIMEMTDVEPDGRITDNDLGLWSDEQIPAFARIVKEVHKYGSRIGVQIAHAGRKAQDAEQPVAPSAIAFNDSFKTPRALTTAEVKEMIVKFGDAAERAVKAGVDMIELHGAHGYLIHQFQSPRSNKRDDEYGKDLALFGVEVIREVKSRLPEGMPLAIRISAVEYADDGYDIDYGIELARRYKEAGVDVLHVSTGGEGEPGARKPGNYPGFQVPAARAIREALGVPVIAVGMLEDPLLAEKVLADGDADLIGIGRGLLKDPYWTYHAIEALTGSSVRDIVPVAYRRGF